MTDGLTQDEYGLHLQDLKRQLEAYIETGEGDPKRIQKEAEELLELREQYAEIYARHPEIEGLCCAFIARRQQMKVLGVGQAPGNAPGCLLGWFLRGRGR
jgi:hypothetical protein